MTTENIIAERRSAKRTESLQAVNPTTKAQLPDLFPVATEEEIDASVAAAHKAWKTYKQTTGKEKARFLRTIAKEIEQLGDVLINRAMAESGLPEGRIIGERGRTCNQLRLFADLVEEGSWVDATIDEAMPDRQPLARADIRKMLVALGPVAVFTASNFPLAFSTAGGDTASALAAGCTVVVKAHPSHLGTNALVATAITRAAEQCNLPEGVFSTLVGGIETGQQLVKHPLIKAVGFTGSFRGGKALFDLVNSRPEPIPVYAEMGSNNPIFILQEKLKTEQEDLATMIAGSVNLGAGQFCTNPGLLVLQKSDTTTAFLQALKDAFATLQSATMLNEGIFESYQKGKAACIAAEGVSLVFSGENPSSDWKGEPGFATVSGKRFLQNNHLQEEIFGPFTLAVLCEDAIEVNAIAQHLQGQLTATIMGTTEELANSTALIELLSQKAGRVIFNGVPTGVEVCTAMHHGGPFPASSNALFTSVGTDAIKRFVRPVAFQDMPEMLLPKELKTENPLDIWRTVNGEKRRG